MILSFMRSNFYLYAIPIQKRESLNNDEINKLINFCNTSREKFVEKKSIKTRLNSYFKYPSLF